MIKMYPRNYLMRRLGQFTREKLKIWLICYFSQEVKLFWVTLPLARDKSDCLFDGCLPEVQTKEY